MWRWKVNATITEKVCTKVCFLCVGQTHSLHIQQNRFVNLFIAYHKNSVSFSFFRLRFRYFQRSSCASDMLNSTTAIGPRGNSYSQYKQTHLFSGISRTHITRRGLLLCHVSVNSDVLSDDFFRYQSRVF